MAPSDADSAGPRGTAAPSRTVGAPSESGGTGLAAGATRGGTVIPRTPRWDLLIVGGGLVVFGLTVHGGAGARMVALAGLAAAGWSMSRSLHPATAAAGLLGFLPWRGRAVARWSAGAVVAGCLLGFWYRWWTDQPAMPAGLRPSAALAALIGVMEELVYRGYVQGRLRPLGAVAAPMLASGLHTAYKAALFAFPPHPEGRVDLLALAAFTFVFSAFFGLLRERSGTVWPCLAVHAAFDLLAYGDSLTLPWWVWH